MSTFLDFLFKAVSRVFTFLTRGEVLHRTLVVKNEVMMEVVNDVGNVVVIDMVNDVVVIDVVVMDEVVIEQVME
ncbi:hypothetical protein Tco_0903798 [Tanacetum coccineum]